MGFLYSVKNSQETASYYRRKENEEDFEENSRYQEQFTPDREPALHIPYEDISFNETSLNKTKPYTMEYDINLMEGTNLNPLLKQLQDAFKDSGLDPETATEDDKKFNLRGSDPSGSTKEYEGTEGEDIDIDLDK